MTALGEMNLAHIVSKDIKCMTAQWYVYKLVGLGLMILNLAKLTLYM